MEKLQFPNIGFIVAGRYKKDDRVEISAGPNKGKTVIGRYRKDDTCYIADQLVELGFSNEIADAACSKNFTEAEYIRDRAKNEMQSWYDAKNVDLASFEIYRLSLDIALRPIQKKDLESLEKIGRRIGVNYKHTWMIGIVQDKGKKKFLKSMGQSNVWEPGQLPPEKEDYWLDKDGPHDALRVLRFIKEGLSIFLEKGHECFLGAITYSKSDGPVLIQRDASPKPPRRDL